MNNKLYNLMLDMNLESRNMSDIFGSEDKDIINNALKLVIDIASKMHNEAHPIGDHSDCKGAEYYVLKSIKIYFTSREDMDDSLTVKLLCALFFNLGANTVREPDILRDGLSGLIKKLKRDMGEKF